MAEPALLDRLVDVARNYRMTPAERHLQRVSFIAGQTGFDRAYVESVLDGGVGGSEPILKRIDPG